MNSVAEGFPEWTELGQDGGLDPLGMQRPIEAIYQDLLPGLSTITLRYRYYAFFPWILKHYEDHIRHTDPDVFRRFQRRCEAVFALVCCRGAHELGIAGSDWAHTQLRGLAGGARATIDFSVGAATDVDPDLQYLRNRGGAFGGIYATQMAAMGLVTLGGQDNPIPICTDLGLQIAAAFGTGVGPAAKLFFNAVESGSVSLSTLDKLVGLKPAAIRLGGREHRLLVNVLLGKPLAPSAADSMRRRTMLMLLTLMESFGRPVSPEEAKWHWFGAHSGKRLTAATATADYEMQGLWALYQACDLMRLAYETILSAALTVLVGSPSRRSTLEGLVGQLVDFVSPPDTMTWSDFKRTFASTRRSPVTAETHATAMLDAVASGTPEDQVTTSLALIVALVEMEASLSGLADRALSAADYFQSLRTEVNFLRERGTISAREMVELLIRERVLKRHFWVASRKFRSQRAYTFLMEPDDGAIRYRSHFRVAPSSPRLEQALRFLRDMKLTDEEGLTDRGRRELAAA